MKIYCYTKANDIDKMNEDCLVICNEELSILANTKCEKQYETRLYPLVCAVMDGLGGHVNGGFASHLLGKHLLETNLSIGELEKRILQANEKIIQSIRKGYTTISAVEVTKEKITICNCGDSRIYRINKEKRKVQQMTKDDSNVQLLMDVYDLGELEAQRHTKYVMTQCVGHRYCLIKQKTINIGKKDAFILMTDGAYRLVYDEWEIILNSNNWKDTLISTIKIKDIENEDDSTLIIIEID